MSSIYKRKLTQVEQVTEFQEAMKAFGRTKEERDNKMLSYAEPRFRVLITLLAKSMDIPPQWVMNELAMIGTYIAGKQSIGVTDGWHLPLYYAGIRVAQL